MDYPAQAPKTPTVERYYGNSTDNYNPQPAMPSSSLFVRESPRDPLPSSTTKAISSRSAFLESLQERGKASNAYGYTAQSSSSSPTDFKRRLVSPNTASIEVKPRPLATPSSQSKLASHAYTLSHSSTEGEDSTQALPAALSSSAASFATRQFEPAGPNNSVLDTATKREFDHFDSLIRNFKEREDRNQTDEERSKFSNLSSQSKAEVAPIADPIPVASTAIDLSRIEQAISMHLTQLSTTLRNDLQNLHVEMIKQSLAQQSALRSLFETYLPMTSQLMDALTAARDENERLKLKLEGLRSYRK